MEVVLPGSDGRETRLRGAQISSVLWSYPGLLVPVDDMDNVDRGGDVPDIEEATLNGDRAEAGVS